MLPLSRIRISISPVVALAGCQLLAACTLPYQQLPLPGPIAGSVGSDGTAHGPDKPGVPLADRATAPHEPRTFSGSGDFTGKVQKISESPGDDSGTGNSTATGPARNRGDGGVAGSLRSEVTKEGITLNLVGASVAEVAKTVLGDVMGVDYTVSEKVKATITLRTARPVEKAGLLAIFESVLRAEGAAIVVEGNLYKIVPSAEAQSGGGAPLLRSHKRGQLGQLGGIATDIVPLRFVAPAEMERILKSAAPQAGILRVDSSRNLLMLSGTQAELNSLHELIQVFDVDWMRGMSFGIFPIETADPDAIAQELDVIFANDKDSPSKGLVRFVPNRRLKSVLVITSRPEYLKKAETWLTRIDLASKATEKQVNIYHVQHRPAVELAQLLTRVYQASAGSARATASTTARAPGGAAGSVDGGIPAAPAATGAVPAVGGAAGAGSPAVTGAGGSAGLGTTTATSGGSTVGVQPPTQPSFTDSTKSGDAAPLGDALTTGSLDSSRSGGGGLPPDDRASGISVVADEIKNALIITATASEYKRVKRVLAGIDVPINQILLEATIAEVTLNDELKMGVRWFIRRGSSQSSSNSSLQPGGLLPFPITGASPAAAGFQYFLNMTNFQILLNALSAVTNVTTISSPSLMVMENKRAVLQVGDEVPITTQQAVGVQAAGAPVVNSVSFRSTGVILGITPRLSDDGRVFMEIEQEVSSAIATQSSNIDSPTIQQRRVKTTVSVDDGQTIVLAGLMQDNATRNREQIPLFGTIPILGNVFKNKDDTIKRTELLISITPHVIRDQQQIDDVTAEYRDNLNLSTRPQFRAPPDHREQLDRIIR